MPSKEFIEPLFQKVAPFYDLLNNCLSFGIHWVWKKKAVKQVLSFKPETVLDGATGTGDLLSLIENEGIDTLGVDISDPMLNRAREKFPHAKFMNADLTKLPFKDNQFDVSVVGFGIRNVENLDEARSELLRVSKKGIVILEFGSPENIFIRKIYFGFMKIYIPLLGRFFGRYEDYKYLIESSEKFLSGQKFLNLFKKQPEVKKTTYMPLMLGSVYIYKIETSS